MAAWKRTCKRDGPDWSLMTEVRIKCRIEKEGGFARGMMEDWEKMVGVLSIIDVAGFDAQGDCLK
jgi:hypothetical protein